MLKYARHARGGRAEPYRASITLVGAAADPRDRMVAVTARIDDPDRGALRPGRPLSLIHI